MMRRLTIAIASILVCSCGTPTSPATTLSAILLTFTDAATPSLPPMNALGIHICWGGPPSSPRALQMHAAALYWDGHQEDVTTQATWQSANTADATISDTGSVTITAPGTMSFTATYHGMVRSMSMNVSPCEDLLDE